MNENIEKLLDHMEETIINLHENGDEWLASIVQRAFDLVEEKVDDEIF